MMTSDDAAMLLARDGTADLAYSRATEHGDLRTFDAAADAKHLTVREVVESLARTGSLATVASMQSGRPGRRSAAPAGPVAQGVLSLPELEQARIAAAAELALVEARGDDMLAAGWTGLVVASISPWGGRASGRRWLSRGLGRRRSRRNGG